MVLHSGPDMYIETSSSVELNCANAAAILHPEHAIRGAAMKFPTLHALNIQLHKFHWILRYKNKEHYLQAQELERQLVKNYIDECQSLADHRQELIEQLNTPIFPPEKTPQQFSVTLTGPTLWNALHLVVMYDELISLIYHHENIGSFQRSFAHDPANRAKTMRRNAGKPVRRFLTQTQIIIKNFYQTT